MTGKKQSSNALIDDLVRTMFHVEPDVMAALAHDGEAVSLRRISDVEPTTDPLDGVEILVRASLAMALALGKGGGEVSLVTERQAVAAGWSTATLANAAIVVSWGMAIAEPATSLPILLEPDDNAKRAVSLIRVDRRLPTLETLLAARRRARRVDFCAMEKATHARERAPAIQGRRIASLQRVLQDWLGIDALAVELRSDGWTPELTSGNARAAAYVAWVAAEMLGLAAVMNDEVVTAVRVKTAVDAQLAGAPDVTAANLALLLAAGIPHGLGTSTLHFLPPRADVAEALVAAGQRIRDSGDASDDGEMATVDILELRDAAARGYVHVGRRAARRVADRLYDTVRRWPAAGC